MGRHPPKHVLELGKLTREAPQMMESIGKVTAPCGSTLELYVADRFSPCIYAPSTGVWYQLSWEDLTTLALNIGILRAGNQRH